jgi:hypothetical protein
MSPRMNKILVVAFASAVLYGCGAHQPQVSIDVKPSEAEVAIGETVDFFAEVSNVNSASVIWSSTCGSFTSQSNPTTYVAPAAPATCLVIATVDGGRGPSDTATVTVFAPVSVSIDPPAAELRTNDTLAITATVNHATDTSVTWTATCGTITGTETTISYQAPASPTTCTVTATSVEDTTATATSTLTVLPPLDEPPTIDITGPSPWASFSRRASSIFFAADVVDPEGGAVTVTWTSNVSGLLGTGNPLTYNTAPMTYGTHLITARATDLHGNSATDTVTVTIINDPPAVDLYAPLPGAVCRNAAITFSVSVVDPNEVDATVPDESVAWRVGTGDVFATGKTVVESFGAVGDILVVVRATDSEGAYGEDSVDLDVVSCPPVVAIEVPASDVEFVYDGFDDIRLQWYADVTLIGSASDADDGTLTDGSLVWTTDYSGQLSVLGTGTAITARLYSNSCPGVTHTITLTATDSDGNESTAVVRVRIWTLC